MTKEKLSKLNLIILALFFSLSANSQLTENRKDFQFFLFNDTILRESLSIRLEESKSILKGKCIGEANTDGLTWSYDVRGIVKKNKEQCFDVELLFDWNDDGIVDEIRKSEWRVLETKVEVLSGTFQGRRYDLVID